MSDTFTIGDVTLSSRLFLGTGKFSSAQTMIEAVKASGSQLITVALRRHNPRQASDDLYGPLSQLEGVHIMPNTSGAMNAQEAVNAAVMGRELTGSRFVKVEIHPNPHHLLPDPIETYEAAKILVKEGFWVMPYIPADPVLAKRLEDAGCASIMPLGSPIGTGHGIETRAMIRLMVRDASIPVVVDAGLRSPADAAYAMEMGCSAVLANSAIAAADDPQGMAAAFARGVEAGRMAWLAGLMPQSDSAMSTSPLTSFLSDEAS